MFYAAPALINRESALEIQGTTHATHRLREPMSSSSSCHYMGGSDSGLSKRENLPQTFTWVRVPSLHPLFFARDENSNNGSDKSNKGRAGSTGVGRFSPKTLVLRLSACTLEYVEPLCKTGRRFSVISACRRFAARPPCSQPFTLQSPHECAEPLCPKFCLITGENVFDKKFTTEHRCQCRLSWCLEAVQMIPTENITQKGLYAKQVDPGKN